MKFGMTFGRPSPILKNAFRSYHSVGRSAACSIGDEAPIMVYDCKEFSALKQATDSGNFVDQMMSSPYRSKVFSLIPFFCESVFTSKHFVLKMELFPEAGYLKMQSLRMGGVQTTHMPIKSMIPVTKYDYWGASWKCWTKQN